jgi:dipeptidase E
MNLLLLSNGKLANQGYLEYALPWISEHFNASAETPKRILFVPYALKDHDGYVKKAADALAPLGMEVISAHQSPDPKALLNQVDGVFVGGGNTFRLLDELQRSGLDKAIAERVRKGMPYMGASAGTNVAGPTIRTTNDMPIVQPQSFDAMGLVPFQINPHYVEGKFHYEEYGRIVPYSGESRTDRIKEFHEENATPVLGLREGSALRVIDSEIALLGVKPAVLFEQGKAPIELENVDSLAVLQARHVASGRSAEPVRAERATNR